MRAGEFPDGSRTLRAKIDMASNNINLRDPVLYRILRAHHHRTGDAWCIYPMYDWAHGQSDSIENISFSICTLDLKTTARCTTGFVTHWAFIDPDRWSRARLNINYMVMSKRKLLQLVKEKHVSGWNDPRMPTISGLRRRGYTLSRCATFAPDIGVAKFNSTIDYVRLENAIRDHLNQVAPRRMGCVRSDQADDHQLAYGCERQAMVEMVSAGNNPEDESAGHREVRSARSRVH